MNAAASFNDTAVVTVPIQEKQSKTEGEEDYEAIERLIDSISRDFSRKGINSRLKALARKSSRNAATICDHILAEQTGLNI
jgi:type I site-specific restriction-modification system R (restriction) subunit